VPLHERGDIKLGLLGHLDLANVAVLDREDAGGLPLDLLSGSACHQRLDQGLEVSLSCQGSHGGDHFFADGTNLGGLGVTRLLQLVVLLFREGNAEHAHDVSVGGASINITLDDALLLLNQRAELVPGHVHAVEVKKAVVSLNVFHTKLHFAVAHGLIVVEISQGELNDASLEPIRGNFLSLCFRDDGLATFLR